MFLTGGGWAEVPKVWLDKHMRRLMELLEASDHLKILPKCLSHTLVDFIHDLDEPVEIPEAIVKMSGSLKLFDKPVHSVLPSDLKASLRPYQTEGVNWLSFLKAHQLGALLADDMGLGKTLQSICILEGKSLIIAPTSVLYNWENEIKRFRPSLKINIYHGPGRKVCATEDNITLTTYSIARLDVQALSAVDWDIVILDEAQNIKNPESKIAQAVFGLSGGFKLALTGTPIENRLDDVWSLFYFLNRGLLGSRKDFYKNYIKASESSDETDSLLRRKIQPFVLRRIKSEVAKELPSRTNVILYNELDEEEITTYQAIEAATKKDILEKLQVKNTNIMKILEALLRLRQAACHLGMLPGQERKGSSKINLLLSGLEKMLSRWAQSADFLSMDFFP